MPRGARPGRQLEEGRLLGCQAAFSVWSGLPRAAIAGSQRWPVVMTACRWRSSAAASAAWACPVDSLLWSRPVRCANRAA